MEQIIYLEPEDDILTIRDRLNLAEARRVLLVVPPYSSVLRSRVDLRLVQRQADQLKIEVALVTRDSEIRIEAKEIGLPLFNSIEQGRKRPRWRHHDEEDFWAPGRSDEAWHAAAARSNAPASRWMLIVRRVLAWTVFVGVFIVFGILAGLSVPSAQVTLVPHSEMVNVTLYAALDSNLSQVDLASARVPGKYVSVEVAGVDQIETTGEKFIPASTAKGSVTFINQLGMPINIPQGTAVRTSAFGTVMRYFTLADVTVPGGFGAQAEAPIEAMEPGEAGNVAANLINEVEGVAAISVKVTNPRATGGGGSRRVQAVTQEDRERVRAKLLDTLVQQAYIQMVSEMGDREFIPVETLFIAQVLDETYDRFVTEEATTVALEMRVSVLGLKVNQDDTNTLIYAEMAARVPPDYELIADGLAFEHGTIILPADATGDILVELSGKGYMIARFDQDQIRQAIAGKSVSEAAAYLENELRLQSAPDIKVRPEWLGRVPWLPLRTEIEIKREA